MSSLYNNNEAEAEADNDDDYVYSPSSTKSSSPSKSLLEKQQHQQQQQQQNRHDSKSLYEKFQILLSNENEHENELSSSNQTTMTTTIMEFHGERCLVGWILLTRLDQDDLDCAWLKYSTILISFAKQLLLIEQQQQQQQNLHKKQTTSEENLLLIYIRLISQVTSRLSVYPNELGEILFQTWIDCCCENNNNNNNNEKSSSSSILFIPGWRKVHIDVLTSLDIWMMELSDPIKINELRILERIWKIYVQISSKAAATTTITTDCSDDDKVNSEKDDDGESKMLPQTLLAILGDDDDNDNNNDKDDYYSMKSWHDLVLAIFQSHGHQLMPDSLLPVILCTNIPALTSSSSSDEKSFNNNYQNAWYEWIFSLIQARVTTINLSSNNTFMTPNITANNPTLAHFGDGNQTQTQTSTTLSFLKDPEAIHNLNKMLLAHAVAPNITTKTTSEKISLREMAWQTLTAIGENCGWRWSLMEDKNNSSSTTLGNGTTICTWVRLASGELNIQLQQELLLLSASSPPPPPSSSLSITSSSNIENVTTTTNSTQQQQQQQQQASSLSSSPSSLILPISHSCARVLMSVVQFCVQLEEEPHRMPISSDSLLHLRQSLEQSLWTLVEYLQLQSQSQAQQQQQQQQNNKEEEGPMSSSSLYLFLPIAIRLFGALLMEVDIWDLLRPQQEESGHPKEILNALIQTLPMENLASSNYSLLPGLVNIIGDAVESNDEKQQQLILIWDPLFEYLIRYWKDHKHIIMDDDSIAWACACTELWSDHHPAISISSGPGGDNDDDDDYDEKKKRRLIVLLIDWIQTALQRIGSNPDIGATMPIPPSLSLVLGCYMVLCKDRSHPPKQHESRVIVRALQLCEQAR